jgi:predicted phosphodiesterase
VVHGHMSWDLRRLIDRKPDFLFSGHDHFPSEKMLGNVRRINPGALHRADQFTVALVDLETGEVNFLPLSE